MKSMLNGQLVDSAQAAVNIADAGFQHAVGLFETMWVQNGRAFHLEAHLQRLARSALELGLVNQLATDPLTEAVRQTIEANALDRARLRLTLTPGSVSLLRGDAKDAANAATQPTLLIEPLAPIEYDPAYFEKGVIVLIAAPMANPFDPAAGHKTLNYWSRLRALRQAAGAGAGEIIWLNITNHLAGGAVSNLFLVKDGALLTPIAHGEEVEGALPAPVLPGVTRAAVIELAQQRGLTLHRRMLSVSDLLDADEAFLTNSGWGVLPVTKVEQKPIGAGKVGPITADLRKDLLTLIDQETSADS